MQTPFVRLTSVHYEPVIRHSFELRPNFFGLGVSLRLDGIVREGPTKQEETPWHNALYLTREGYEGGLRRFYELTRHNTPHKTNSILGTAFTSNAHEMTDSQLFIEPRFNPPSNTNSKGVMPIVLDSQVYTGVGDVSLLTPYLEHAQRLVQLLAKGKGTKDERTKVAKILLECGFQAITPHVPLRKAWNSVVDIIEDKATKIWNDCGVITHQSTLTEINPMIDLVNIAGLKRCGEPLTPQNGRIQLVRTQRNGAWVP